MKTGNNILARGCDADLLQFKDRDGVSESVVYWRSLVNPMVMSSRQIVERECSSEMEALCSADMQAKSYL